MGFLANILAALAVATVIELDARDGFGLVGGLLAFGGLLPAPHLLARAARRLAIAGRWRASQRIALALDWIAPLAFAGVLLAGWREAAARLPGTSVLDWPGPGLFVLLAPYLAFELLAIDAKARMVTAAAHSRRGYSRFLGRQFGAALVPLAGYLLLSGGVGAVAPLRIRLEEVSLYASLYAGAILLAFASALPWILSKVWDTKPLDAGPMRDFLVDLARRVDFRFRDVLLWRTGGSLSNAAVVGFTPGQRVVLLSDALLRDLDWRQLAAVFGHEMGHSVRRHALLFTTWTLLLFLTFDSAVHAFEPASETVLNLLLVAVAALWYFGFGYLSRRAELDADLFALDVTRDAADLVEALERVGGGRRRWSRGWRHFSVAQRILFLRAVASDPDVGGRLRRELDRAARAGGVALVLVAAAWAHQQWSRLDGERAWVRLRLGDYPGAVALLETGEERGAEALRLARRGLEAADAEGQAPTADALLSGARATALEGEWQAARDLAVLAALRDNVDARSVARWLDAIVDDAPDAPELAGALPPGWAPVLERARQ
ncbi:MAG: M48 family metalloprotease [Planctomycetota bacterium]